MKKQNKEIYIWAIPVLLGTIALGVVHSKGGDLYLITEYVTIEVLRAVIVMANIRLPKSQRKWLFAASFVLTMGMGASIYYTYLAGDIDTPKMLAMQTFNLAVFIIELSLGALYESIEGKAKQDSVAEKESLFNQKLNRLEIELCEERSKADRLEIELSNGTAKAELTQIELTKCATKLDRQSLDSEKLKSILSKLNGKKIALDSVKSYLCECSNIETASSNKQKEVKCSKCGNKLL